MSKRHTKERDSTRGNARTILIVILMTWNGKLHHHVSINLCVPNHTGVKWTRLMPKLIKVIGGLDAARKALKRRRLNISLEIHGHSKGHDTIVLELSLWVISRMVAQMFEMNTFLQSPL